MNVVVEKELPKGWAICNVNDVSDVLGGKRLPKGHDYSETKTNFPYVRVVDFKNMGIDTDNLKYVPENTAREIAKYTISKDDLYISIAGSIGKIGLIPQILDNALLTENAAKLCKIKIHNKYLCHVLNSRYCQKQILSAVKSTNQPKLALFRIKEISFPLPPIEEQKRIVTKIEELFSLVDSAKDTLEKTKILLKQYRQSILKHAFEGKLTSLNEKTSTFNEVVLSDLVIKSQNGLTGRPNDINKGILRLGIETVTGSNSIYVDETKSKFIEVLDSKIKNYIVNFNDLFICRQNGNKNYVGRICVYKGKNPKLIFSDSLIKITIDENQCLSEYIAFFINSKLGRIQLEQYCSTTAGNYSINGTNFKKIMIQLPRLDEQKIIVSKIEESFSLIDKNEILIDQLLLQYSQIKNSILKQAFEGKLVPQDPNDEPAEVLLERIIEEKNHVQ